MDELLPCSTSEVEEINSLATELSTAYRRMVVFYRDQLGLSTTEAESRACGADMTPEEAADDLAQIWERPPEQVTWADLARLAERDPNAVLDVWDDLKGAAQDELSSGHRAAQALDWQRRPYARARFLAIRENFRADTPASMGVEAALIDLAAEAFNDYLELSEQLHRMLSAEAEVERDDLERNGRWRLRREAVSTAIEEVERRAERAHKRFLRTVKSLHELQRSVPTLYVAHAGQINVGKQQVNVAADEPAAQASDIVLPK